MTDVRIAGQSTQALVAKVVDARVAGQSAQGLVSKPIDIRLAGQSAAALVSKLIELRLAGLSAQALVFPTPAALVEYWGAALAEDPARAERTIFNDAVIRGAASMPVIQQGTSLVTDPTQSGYYYYPLAENFPVTEFTDPDQAWRWDPYYTNEGIVCWQRMNNGSGGTVVEPAPPLSAGSTHSRRQRTTFAPPSSAIVEAETRLGQARKPRLSKTSVLGQSIRYQVGAGTIGIVPSILDFYMYNDWISATGTRYYVEHRVEYHPLSAPGSRWEIDAEFRTPANPSGPSSSKNWFLPAGAITGDPFSAGPHFISLSVNAATQTMTVVFDGQTWTSAPDLAIWPADPAVAMASSSSSQMSNFCRWNYFNINAVPELTWDEFRIFSDTPLEVWAPTPPALTDPDGNGVWTVAGGGMVGPVHRLTVVTAAASTVEITLHLNNSVTSLHTSTKRTGSFPAGTTHTWDLVGGAVSEYDSFYVIDFMTGTYLPLTSVTWT